MKPCMASSCAFGRVEERREGQRRSSSTMGTAFRRRDVRQGYARRAGRARGGGAGIARERRPPRPAMRHIHARDAPRARANHPPPRSARASVGGPQGHRLEAGRGKHHHHLAVADFERRARAFGHARRRGIRVRRAGRSPVKRVSASGECAPLRECDSAERRSIEPRFLLVGAALAKESSNQIRRCDRNIST